MLLGSTRLHVNKSRNPSRRQQPLTGNLNSEACSASTLSYFWSASSALEVGHTFLRISGCTAADHRGLGTVSGRH